jgi:H+/Cl- antiporter ClcA
MAGVAAEVEGLGGQPLFALGIQATGVLLGMAAGLAGATQLPVMSLAFVIRIAGAPNSCLACSWQPCWGR